MCFGEVCPGHNAGLNSKDGVQQMLSDRHEVIYSTKRYSMRMEDGFTLLELLVVMVIIGLLASYVAPRYFNQVGKSEVKAARAQLDAFDKALGTYRLDVGHYPNTEQGLKGLVEAPASEPKWAGPYLSKAVPMDPWGNPYLYRNPGEKGHDYELSTLGKDGQAGGSGLDADVSIWDSGR